MEEKQKKGCTQRSLDETSDTDAEILNSKKGKMYNRRSEQKLKGHLI